MHFDNNAVVRVCSSIYLEWSQLRFYFFKQVDNDNHIECNCDEGANLCYSFWHVENKSKVDIANDKNTPGVEIGSPANRTSLQKYVLRTFETFCNDTNLLKSILLKSIESESNCNMMNV